MPIFRIDDAPWHEPPGHVGGFSKYLVTPDTHETERFDFRISRYPIRGRVDLHTHEVAEHVYYILEGLGVATYGDEQRVVDAGTVIFVPPGVKHAIENTGDRDLVFIVVTSPPSDIPR